MTDHQRPDPDDLLRLAQEEESTRSIGKLRVFLGMSAGVGKTYSMLKAAHQKIAEGVAVVIGVVETHGRRETEALLQNLPIIPKKKVSYRGTTLEEMDLDAILERKPSLVIVDELPHTNAPTLRHVKRYQDVLEILDAGIDVYTALNIQHLESRKEAVETIAGTSIRETVPDGILDRAHLVELVDIAPSELIKRLHEGKVYLGDKAEQAKEHFFREDKLTALREIALRITAERVDQDLRRLVGTRSQASPWHTNERLLVAVSHSPSSERLLRATRRLASSLEAPWIALSVDTGLSLSDQDQAQLVKNLNLARDLNAEVISTKEIDVATAIQRICQRKQVTQVILGRPTRRWFRNLMEGGSLLQRLLADGKDLDIHVIRQAESSPLRPSLAHEISYYRPQEGGWMQYWYALWTVFGTALLGGFLNEYSGYKAVGFFFLLSVIAIGLFGSLGAVIFAATLSALLWNFLFIPPVFTFAISKADDFLMCVSFFVVALITGFLTSRIRFHERVIRDREEKTNALYEVLQDLTDSAEIQDFLKKVSSRLGRLMEADCGIVLKTKSDQINWSETKAFGIHLNEKDLAVGQWSYENKKPAGWSTETLSQSKNLFLPLVGLSETVGVFILHPLHRKRRLDLGEEGLLFSILRQIGLSVERRLLSERLAESQRLQESEKLHQTLLNSISHEMKTPLTAVIGSATALRNEAMVGDNAYVRAIAGNLHEAGDRLNRVIENLLDMSRLNSGVLSLKTDWHDFNDLLSVALQKLARPLEKHKLRFQHDEDVALVRVDFSLMEHAVSNLVLNAATYTPPGSEIRIRSFRHGERLICEIQDDGPGIPEVSLPLIFDKFYRVPGSPAGGTGLGLSIVKSIVELHGGSVRVENIQPHGVRFTIDLPTTPAPPLPQEPS